jgi:hypothetical protein
MSKYPLIGVSIITVILLVLGSLTNVVGYQSVKSTAVNDSPLFSVRTRRATNQQQNIVTSQYLGKGNGNVLYFPIRDNKIESLKRTIEIISQMDDKTFEKFTDLIIQRTMQDDTLKDINPNKIVQLLRQIRTQPKTITNMIMSRSNERLDPTNFNCYTILWGPPICYIFIAIILVLVMLIYGPILIVLRLLTMANCPTAVVSECPTQFYTFCGTCKVAMR